MKKYLLLLVILLGFHSAWAHYVEVDGIRYSLNDVNKTATVCAKVLASDNTLRLDYSGDVVIPEMVNVDDVTYSVTELSGLCFKNCINLQSITIPNTITKFGNSCFNNCI